MATPRQLQRPPVTEALVDIRASVDIPEETLRAFGLGLKPEFPKLKVWRNFTANMAVKDGMVITPTPTTPAFAGVHLANEDETQIVQFRLDGFTFNNLRRYMGGAELIESALRLWQRFAETANPGSITRVAMRYLNRLELPLEPGTELGKYLAAAPPLPDDVPQEISEFITRVVAHDGGDRPEAVVMTQRLFIEDTRRVVIIDIDAIIEREVSAEALPARLQALRTMANRTFFGLITEETARLYD